jgi:hypothetical protein
MENFQVLSSHDHLEIFRLDRENWHYSTGKKSVACYEFHFYLEVLPFSGYIFSANVPGETG